MTDTRPIAVLITEDEKALAHALRDLLTGEGMEVVLAENGTDACRKLKERPFDVMLLDMLMPELDGIGVLQFMKDEGVHVPTIVLSNLESPKEAEHAKELGAVAFLIKANIEITSVVDRIKDLVRGA